MLLRLIFSNKQLTRPWLLSFYSVGNVLNGSQMSPWMVLNAGPIVILCSEIGPIWIFIYFFHKYLHLSQSKLIFLTKSLIMNAFYRRYLHIFLTLECISVLVGQWTSLVRLHLVSNYTCICMLWGLYTRRLTNCVYYVCR